MDGLERKVGNAEAKGSSKKDDEVKAMKVGTAEAKGSAKKDDEVNSLNAATGTNHEVQRSDWPKVNRGSQMGSHLSGPRAAAAVLVKEEEAKVGNAKAAVLVKEEEAKVGNAEAKGFSKKDEAKEEVKEEQKAAEWTAKRRKRKPH
jgi:hypothetical protein